MKELTEIINAHYENGKCRTCPKCSSKLKLDISSKTLKIFCPNCGFREPCHLRHLEINEVNCSSCPYSPSYNENLVLKTEKAKLMKTLRKGIAHRPKQLTLGVIQKLIEENLEYSKLKRKCVQAWNSQSSKELNSAFL